MHLFTFEPGDGLNMDDGGGFEVYRPPHLTRRHILGVALRTQGFWYLSAAARGALGNPTHVLLLFDAVRRAVGFQAAQADADGAYPLKPKSSTVYARPFCRHYDIPLVRRTWTGRMEGDLLVIMLDE